MTWHIFSNKKLTSLVNDGVAMLGLKTVSYSDIMWWMPKFVNVIDVEFAIEVTAVGRMVAYTWKVKIEPLFFSDLQ